MTNSEKLTKSKAVITYLAEQFPQCFTESGEAKPLKIGIFDDLAERLKDDDKVSKTRIRTAIRHYTNSWRYLRCIKAGVARVDLDGAEAGIVEEGHQQHAEEELAASKAQAAEKAAAKAAEVKAAKREAGDDSAGSGKTTEARKPKPAKPRPSAKPASAGKMKPKPAQGQNSRSKKAAIPLQAVELSQLKEGQQVQVKVGLAPMPGTILAIEREDVQVQLNNGLTMKVKAENIFLG